MKILAVKSVRELLLSIKNEMIRLKIKLQLAT